MEKNIHTKKFREIDSFHFTSFSGPPPLWWVEKDTMDFFRTPYPDHNLYPEVDLEVIHPEPEVIHTEPEVIHPDPEVCHLVVHLCPDPKVQVLLAHLRPDPGFLPNPEVVPEVGFPPNPEVPEVGFPPNPEVP